MRGRSGDLSAVELDPFVTILFTLTLTLSHRGI